MISQGTRIKLIVSSLVVAIVYLGPNTISSHNTADKSYDTILSTVAAEPGITMAELLTRAAGALYD